MMRAFPFLFAMVFLGFALPAGAEISVSPVAPYTTQDGSHVYYPATKSNVAFGTSTTSFVDSGDGFSEIEVDSLNSKIEFDVSIGEGVSFDGDNEHLVLSVEALRVGNSYSPMPIKSLNGVPCGDGNCQFISNSLYRAVRPTKGETVRIALVPYYLCSGGTEYLASECDATNGLYNPDGVRGVTLRFVLGKVSNTSTSTAPPSGTDDSTTQKKIIYANFQNSKPKLSSPSCRPQLDHAYVPGDQEILINTHSISATGGANGAPIQKLVVFASETSGSAPAPAAHSLETQYPIVGRFLYASGKRSMGGFTNTTTGKDHVYSIRFAIRDAAGILTPLHGCSIDGVQSASIQGLLKKSGCFIATAAAGGRENPGLSTLRKFRNRVMRPSALGNALVRAYEATSPALAQALVDQPILRYPVLLLLVPIEAWAALGLEFKRLGSLIPSSEASETKTPYLDRLKEKLGPAPVTPSVIDTVRANQPPKKSSSETPTIDRIRKDAPAKEQGISLEEERKRLIETHGTEGGAIQAVREGRSGLEARKTGESRHALGVGIGLSQTRNIEAVAGAGGQSFDAVYGKSWAPDFRFSSEYQLFRGENIGSLGLVGGIGFSTFKGKGIYEFRLRNGLTGEEYTTSNDTIYRFNLIPFSLGLNYRFNLFRILRPYALLAPTGAIYWESQQDKGKPNKGFSTGVTYAAGVSLLLNFLSSSNSWDLYSTYGIHRYYATVEYNRMQTFSGDVRFDVYGVMAGLTFEY